MLHFEGATQGEDGASASSLLSARDLQDAKVAAAIRYACMDLAALPTGYSIVAGAQGVVYRYPE